MAQIKLFRGSPATSLPEQTQDGALYVIQTSESSGEIWTDINNKHVKIGTGSNSSNTPILAKTTEEWSALSSELSAKGTFYVYLDARAYKDENENLVYVPGVKIGDGKSYIGDLPFVNVTAEQINSWTSAANIVAANNSSWTSAANTVSTQRNFWNSKVDAYLETELKQDGREEVLVLTRTREVPTPPTD